MKKTAILTLISTLTLILTSCDGKSPIKKIFWFFESSDNEEREFNSYFLPEIDPVDCVIESEDDDAWENDTLSTEESDYPEEVEEVYIVSDSLYEDLVLVDEKDFIYDLPEQQTTESETTEKIFYAVEQMPSFPGGEKALFDWLSQNIVYPANAVENNIQGRVIVKFVVNTDGSISDVDVVRKVDPDLDREAVRVVKELPDFIPAKMNGVHVRAYFTLPISFRLE